MENRIMTAILVIIILIGLLSIGYLIVKIMMLMKLHKTAERMSISAPDFDVEKISLLDEIELDRIESTVLLGCDMEEKRSLARLQFSTIAGKPSSRIELIEKKATLLGRGPDVDILIEDMAISKHHLKLLFKDDTLQIQDLGTTNGTSVNGIRLTSTLQISDRTESIVEIGRTCFSIHIM